MGTSTGHGDLCVSSRDPSTLGMCCSQKSSRAFLDKKKSTFLVFPTQEPLKIQPTMMEFFLIFPLSQQKVHSKASFSIILQLFLPPISMASFPHPFPDILFVALGSWAGICRELQWSLCSRGGSGVAFNKFQEPSESVHPSFFKFKM